MEENELLPPIHSGEILLEEFLRPLEISQYRLAKDIGVPVRRINEIVQGRYDLEIEKDRLKGRLEQEVKVYFAAA